MRPVAALALMLLAGCYTYRPLAGPAPGIGAAVDVELNDEGVRQLAPQVGPAVDHVQGRVMGIKPDALDLSVTGVETIRGEPTQWNGERLELPQRYVQQIQERRLSAGGTGLLGGALAAGLVAALRISSGQGSSAGPAGKPGGTGH